VVQKIYKEVDKLRERGVSESAKLDPKFTTSRQTDLRRKEKKLWLACSEIVLWRSKEIMMGSESMVLFFVPFKSTFFVFCGHVF